MTCSISTTRNYCGIFINLQILCEINYVAPSFSNQIFMFYSRITKFLCYHLLPFFHQPFFSGIWVHNNRYLFIILNLSNIYHFKVFLGYFLLISVIWVFIFVFIVLFILGINQLFHWDWTILTNNLFSRFKYIYAWVVLIMPKSIHWKEPTTRFVNMFICSPDSAILEHKQPTIYMHQPLWQRRFQITLRIKYFLFIYLLSFHN